MVNQITLQSFISKYYLNGLNNQVKWKINNNTLTVYAGEKGRVCKVVLNKFPFENCELGIFDTNKFSKLLSITSGDLMLHAEKLKSVYTKLYLQDSNFDLTYALADPLVLSKVTYYNDPDDYDVELELSKEHIGNLIKAKNALLDQNLMMISTTQDMDGSNICEFIFGDNTGFSNKISYQMRGKVNEAFLSIPFNSDIFKDILNSNRDMDSGTLKLSKIGMLKINFTSETDSSEYYIARNE